MIIIFIDFRDFWLIIQKMKNTLPFGRQQDILIEPRESLTSKNLKNILKKCGLKITDQRLAILKVLNSGPRYHKTAQEILAEVKQFHKAIGFATVYRFLKKLTQCQMVSELSMGAGSACYELISNRSHYHIACMNCGKIIEFKNKSIESTLNKIMQEKKFKLKKQVVEIYVSCDKCP